MKRAYRFWSDPSHGWLEVTSKDLAEVGLKTTDITDYSYVKETKDGVFYYLEEDCDAEKFLKAFRDKFKHDPKIKEFYTLVTAIRSYARVSS
jgi:hypothetical protein